MCLAYRHQSTEAVTTEWTVAGEVYNLKLSLNEASYKLDQKSWWYKKKMLAFIMDVVQMQLKSCKLDFYIKTGHPIQSGKVRDEPAWNTEIHKEEKHISVTRKNVKRNGLLTSYYATHCWSSQKSTLAQETGKYESPGIQIVNKLPHRSDQFSFNMCHLESTLESRINKLGVKTWIQDCLTLKSKT